uniref:BED-type domain-containing protein n=1 Tax=Acrobeloides nanus TaxID=290746 RepID=A0A914C166_9BILA
MVKKKKFKEKKEKEHKLCERIGWRKCYDGIFPGIEASSLGNQYFLCIPCNTDLIFGKMGRSAIRQHLDSGRHRISINGSGTETISPSISLYQSSEEGELQPADGLQTFNSLFSMQSKQTRRYNIPYCKFKQKYAEWFPEIGPSERGDDYYYCKLCEMDLKLGSMGPGSIKQHMNSTRHKQRAITNPMTLENNSSSNTSTDQVVGISCVNIKNEEVDITTNSESISSIDSQIHQETAPMETLLQAISVASSEKSLPPSQTSFEEKLKSAETSQTRQKSLLVNVRPATYQVDKSNTQPKSSHQNSQMQKFSSSLSSRLITHANQSAQEWKSKYETAQSQLSEALREAYKAKQEYYGVQQELLTSKQELESSKFELAETRGKLDLLKNELLQENPDLDTLKLLLTENFPLLTKNNFDVDPQVTKDIKVYKQINFQQASVIKDLKNQLKQASDNKIEAAKLITELQQSRDEAIKLKVEKELALRQLKQAQEDFNDAMVEIDNLKLALASE